MKMRAVVIHVQLQLIFVLVVLGPVGGVGGWRLGVGAVLVVYFSQFEGTCPEEGDELVLLELVGLGHALEMQLLLVGVGGREGQGEGVDGGGREVVDPAELLVQFFREGVVVFAEGVLDFVLVHVAELLESHALAGSSAGVGFLATTAHC